MIYNNKQITHLLESKETGRKINLEPMKLGIEPGPSGPGYGVIVIGNTNSEGSQQRGKSSRARVSDIKSVRL